MSGAIREAREAKGWSQSKLGRRLGVTASTVQLWEAGQTSPKRSRWPKITAELGLSLRDLALDGDAESFVAGEPTIPVAQTRGEREWLEIYRKLDKECRRAALALLKNCFEP